MAENVIVGSEGCKVNEILCLIKATPPENFSILMDKWTRLAIALNIDSAGIKSIRTSSRYDSDIEVTLLEVITVWMGNTGKEATLDVLARALEDAGGKSYADALRQKYVPSIELMTRKVFDHPFPETLSYYVNRTLITRSIISAKVFEQNSEDIFMFNRMHQSEFLFRRMYQSELSELAGNQTLTGTSSDQLRYSLSVKFMTLDKVHHFDMICKKSKHPVHWLRKEADGRLRWIRSSKGMGNLQKCVDQEQDEFDEEAFCRHLGLSSTPVLICDTPGMGKSVLLAQIGSTLSQLYPNRTVLFAAFTKFIKLVKSLEMNDEVTIKMIEVALQKLYGEPALQSNMEETTPVTFEVLFDGFDEVDSADYKLAHSTLKNISTSFKSIRVWVTSRPHQMEELETSLHLLGYNIRPFDEQDQVQFLSSFWSRNKKFDEDRSRLFAENCLKSLKSKMDSTSQDIAGIPLQCMLIGEVYEKDAVDYAGAGSEDGPPIGNEIGTITELYRRMIRKKIEKYKSSSDKLCEDELMALHAHLSLEFSFSNEMEALKLGPIPDESGINELFNVGIIVKSSGSYTFLHRTFAEYLVAWFAEDKLRKEEEWTKEVNNFFLGCILKCTGDHFKDDFGINSFEFVKPVICYFLNSFIAELRAGDNFPHICSRLNQETAELLNGIAHACANADLVHLFKLFHGRYESNESYTRTVFTKNFLLRSIEHSSLELVEPIVSQLEKHDRFSMEVQSEALRNAVTLGKFPIVEFLFKKKQLSDIVKNLSYETRRLVHDCVKESLKCSDEEVHNKIQVLQMIIPINRSLLDDKVDGRPPLLFEHVHVKLLIELVRLGADVSAENEDGTILHISGGRELSSSDYHSFLISLPDKSIRKMVHKKAGNDKSTPLTSALERFDPSPETLDVFHRVGADFNHTLSRGSSVLEIGIIKGRNAATLRKLIEHGDIKVVEHKMANAVPNTQHSPLHQSNLTNLLHTAAEWRNAEAVTLLVDEYGLDVNSKDNHGRTPLDRLYQSNNAGDRIATGSAIHERGGRFKEATSLIHVDATNGRIQSVDLLIRFGVDVNSRDEQGNSPLHRCLEPKEVPVPHQLSMVQLLLEKGADLTALNRMNETPFNTAMKNQNLNLEIFILLKSKMDGTSGWTPALYILALKFALQGKDELDENDFISFLNDFCKINHVNVCLSENDGNCAAHIATAQGHLQSLQFLVEKGADLNLKNKLGQTPLHVVACNQPTRYMKMVQFLIGRADAVAKDDEDRTFLHQFILKRPSPSAFHVMVECLVEAGVVNLFNVSGGGCRRNYAYNCGAYPLQLAVGNLTPEINTLELLQSNNIDFNAVDQLGHSILVNALEGYRSLKFISTLINQFKVNLRVIDKQGCSILHHAVFVDYGSSDHLRFFLELGELNVNEVNDRGETPLFCAVNKRLQSDRKNVLKNCKLLVAHGADANIPNNQGVTPLVVVESNYKGDNDDHAAAISSDYLKFFQELGGLNVNEVNEQLIAHDNLFMDNYQIVVGSKDCPINTVGLMIRSSILISSTWYILAMGLNVGSDYIKKFRNDLRLDKITRMEVISELLELWVGNNGSTATLGKLLNVVEEQCGANDVGESLRLHFGLPCKAADNPSIDWNDMPAPFQKRITENFQNFYPTLKFLETLPTLKGPALIKLMTGKKPQLFEHPFPDTLRYYVYRTLITRSIISAKVFEQNSQDIFLFIGLDPSELNMLAGKKLTGTSSDQLRYSSKVNKYMILDRAHHFDKICEKTKHPVHLLRREADGRLRWIRSSGGMDNLQKYVDHLQDEFDEEAFCRHLDSGPTPVFICDSPGMGKSVLLAHIGSTLSQIHPDRVVMFVAFTEFMKRVKSIGMDDEVKTIEDALQQLTGEPILRRLNSEEAAPVTFELLLDGFDELDSSDHKLAHSILKQISTSFKSTRLWVTSRPHLMEELETSLNLLGYNIRPFDQQDQVKFLSSFWSRKEQLDKERTWLFARKCLKSRMDSTSQDIAGIPLQCMLIGEVYEDDAVEYARLGNEDDPPIEIEIGTITELYRRLIWKKIEKYKSLNDRLGEDELMGIHARLGVEFIFPDETEALQLGPIPNGVVVELLKVGIIVKSPGSYAFLHKTFAEYFVAWFVIDKLEREGGWTVNMNRFFLRFVLRCRDMLYYETIIFEYPVICYFLNSSIAGVTIGTYPLHLSSQLHTESPQLLKTIAYACAYDDIVQIFILFHDRYESDETYMSSTFTNDFLYYSIRHSSLELVKSVVSQLEKHGVFSMEVQSRALRYAVRYGKFPIVEFLIKKACGIVEEMSYGTEELVRDCIEMSVNRSAEEVKNRIQVLRMLIRINGSLLNCKVDGSPPLLLGFVHVKLLIELVRLGADILADDERDCTVLHFTVYRKLSSSDYHTLVMSVPDESLRQLAYRKNRLGDTPLTSALVYIDPVPETLDVFHRVGADFNHTPSRGSSVLEMAIRWGRSAVTIRKIIQLGGIHVLGYTVPNTRHSRSHQNTNLLHVAAEWGNAEAVGVLVDEFRIDVNSEDELGREPLDRLIESNKKGDRFATGLALKNRGGRFKNDKALTVAVTQGNVQSVRLLISFGIDVNGKDEDGDTALHKSVGPKQYSLRQVNIAQLLLHSGADVSALNKLGNTPFNTATKNKKLDLQTFILLKSKMEETNTMTQAVYELALQLALREKNNDKLDEGQFVSILNNFFQFHQEKVCLFESDGNCAVHAAARWGHLKALELLVEKGADLNVRNRSGQTPLHVVARYSPDGYMTMVEYLIANGADAVAKDNDNRTFLHQFILGFPSPSAFHLMVECLIEAGVVNLFNVSGGGCGRFVDNCGTFPLQLAVRYLEPEIKTLELLQPHVDFSAVDNLGHSILFNAVKGYRRVEFISTLINRFNVDWRDIDEGGWSILHHAAAEFSYCRSDYLKFFLELGGLDVNKVNDKGETALFCAVRSDDMVKVNLLVAHGADVNIPNDEGFTPLDLAENKWDDEMMKLLCPT